MQAAAHLLTLSSSVWLRRLGSDAASCDATAKRCWRRTHCCFLRTVETVDAPTATATSFLYRVLPLMIGKPSAMDMAVITFPAYVLMVVMAKCFLLHAETTEWRYVTNKHIVHSFHCWASSHVRPRSSGRWNSRRVVRNAKFATCCSAACSWRLDALGVERVAKQFRRLGL